MNIELGDLVRLKSSKIYEVVAVFPEIESIMVQEININFTNEFKVDISDIIETWMMI